jgi:plastocyanin
MVTLEVGSQTGFLSGLNGTSPAVDTIAVGGTMTWFLSDEDLDDHAIESVGLPAFVGGYLGYGGTHNGLSVTFSAAGTYLYQDPYWPGTIGTVVVQ